MVAFTTVSVFKRRDVCLQPYTLIISKQIWKLFQDFTLYLDPPNTSSFFLDTTVRFPLWSPDHQDVWHESRGQCWSFSSQSPWNTAGKSGCGLCQKDMTDWSVTGPSGPQIWTVNGRVWCGVLLGQQQCLLKMVSIKSEWGHPVWLLF